MYLAERFSPTQEALGAIPRHGVRRILVTQQEASTWGQEDQKFKVFLSFN